jgi:glycogen operon protein
VSYNGKHNEANGEDGNDGADDNRSWNCGIEGPTDDADVLELRRRQRRNLLATLLLSQGVPMVLHGDELGRTQGGNNNAYCQDNEIAWVDWRLEEDETDLLDFTASLTAFRKRHPVFRRRRFFEGKPIRKADELRDIAWFTPSGEEMKEQNWDDAFGRSIAVFLNGDAIADRDVRGIRIVDDSFLLAFNAHDEDIEFALPNGDYGKTWTVVVDTATGAVEQPGGDMFESGAAINVAARSLVALQRVAT